MAQSQNTTVDFKIPATSMQGLSTYGTMLVGDRALEFYNEKNPEDFIQIPWDEFDYVTASVLLGRKVARFAVFTKGSGHFTFSTRDNKATLRAIREHVPADRLRKSPSFLQIIGCGFKGIFHAVTGRGRK